MRGFSSICWRLQFWYGLLLALVLAGFGLTAYTFQHSALVRAKDVELERRVTTLARFLREGMAPPPGRPAAVRRPPPGGGPDPDGPHPASGDNGPDRDDDPGPPPPLVFRLPSAEKAAFADRNNGGWYYVLWLRNGPSLTRSPTAPPTVPRPAEADLQSRAVRVRARAGFREAMIPLGPGDALLVGCSTAEDEQALHRFGWLLTASAGAILVVGLLGGRWLVGRSLRPISEIGAAAAKISASDLSQRINTADTDSELGQLAQVLNQTFARLEGAFQRQSRFTADAAHELRTPVSVLLMHTQNAQMVPCASEEHAEALAACHRAAQRMRALTEGLLRLARSDAPPTGPLPLTFDCASRAADCVAAIRPLAEPRGITVQTDLLPARARGLPEDFDQVVTNLVANAIHHNFDGGEVRITTWAAPGAAFLTVADNGPGVSPDHWPHLFERFYRPDRSRSRATGGSGLGLAIVKALAEKNGGDVTAEAPNGKGIMFTVRWPATVD